MKKCVICESEFVPYRPSAKYCSHKCKKRQETILRTKKHQENLEQELKPIPCKVCNGIFTPNKYRKDQMYCGQKCLTKAMYDKDKESGKAQEKSKLQRKKHRHKKIKRDSDYKNKIRFGGNKYKVLERDGHKCVKCGKDNPRSLIIHHKDHSGAQEIPNNDMDNLETLCRSCHMTHHSHKDPNHIMYHRKQARLAK